MFELDIMVFYVYNQYHNFKAMLVIVVLALSQMNM